jgi:signal transduction histidine kinase
MTVTIFGLKLSKLVLPDFCTNRSARNRYFKLSVLLWVSNQEKPKVMDETLSEQRVANLGLRIGRTSLKANRGSSALEPSERTFTRAVAGLAPELASTARQAGILEGRDRLAREIHDSLAQSFAGIALHLSATEEEMAAGKGSPLRRVRFVKRLAELGLAEARRSALSLRSTVTEESGLVEGLRMLVERWNVRGRVRCCFRTGHIPEELLPARIQHDLLSIAQAAISNAVRHGKPTVVTVTLRWEAPHLTLRVKDNGSGISQARPKKNEGIGLRSMRERAAQIGAKLAIQADPRGGTRLVVTVPISL